MAEQSFEDIYELNSITKNDPRLKSLEKFEVSSINYKYLVFAISYFMYDCKKDLSIRRNPQQINYDFIGNGIETQFLLTPSPSENSDIYVFVIDTESKRSKISEDKYLFDYNTNILTTNFPIQNGYTLRVVFYIEGAFLSELDDREMNILAEGMKVPYLEENKDDLNVLRYLVTGNAIKFYSQSQHITASGKNVANQMSQVVDALISDYSYKSSDDKYTGLVRRGEL